MKNLIAQPALATPGFVEQFQAYVERWIHRLQTRARVRQQSQQRLVDLVNSQLRCCGVRCC